MRRFVLSLTLQFLVTSPAWVQEAPKGYLWQFRTLTLHPLHQQETRLGRLVENDIVFSSPRVSRRHAAIRWSGEAFELEDVGSSNGTRVNGEPVFPGSAVLLEPGDLIELAEERLLFHHTKEELYRDEIRLRLLGHFLRLNVALPKDYERRAFGRVEMMEAVSEAKVTVATGELEMVYPENASDDGFSREQGAFVGHIDITGDALELSLWGLERGESMTSRRASIGRLKHTTLRVLLTEEAGDDGDSESEASRYSNTVLVPVFETYPDDSEFSLQLSVSLAKQERAVALRDAAEVFALRHRLDPTDWASLNRAAQAKADWVERRLRSHRGELSENEREEYLAALRQCLAWMASAKELGAKKDPLAETEAALRRAAQLLETREQAK